MYNWLDDVKNNLYCYTSHCPKNASPIGDVDVPGDVNFWELL
jgi:hypothetical protein